MQSMHQHNFWSATYDLQISDFTKKGKEKTDLRSKPPEKKHGIQHFKLLYKSNKTGLLFLYLELAIFFFLGGGVIQTWQEGHMAW